ncbi:hypothetical protein [Streptomyces yangpuensis]|uniref:Uncharacterized protein n=1 Tax=Streptomyces yangpuensis TaxID=1648182 RepID=A0ABY5PXR4_9ACTN|nr:hypothetical protein [Streptomyces yangpuensis]UUY48896.1 hypothetical protein NRK68_17855 [Streptomyces yangpuensis]
MHGETGATEEALESMEAAASIAMAPAWPLPWGASEQAHPADNC